MLSWASAYFDRAFNGEFKEAKTGILVMLDATVKAFELAIAFIYTTELRFVKYHVKDFKSEGQFIECMIQLSALSQHLLMPTLDHCATTNLRTLTDANHGILTPDQVVLAFDLLHDKSEVLGAIVRTTLVHFSEKTWDVASRNVFVDWKYGGALKSVPGFMAAFLVANKDFGMGRLRP